jgi:hypothetical protein
MAEKRKLPIGIQTFEEIRRKGFVYVDKTPFVGKLANAAGCIVPERQRPLPREARTF